MVFDPKDYKKVDACTPIIITDTSNNERFKIGRGAEKLWDVFGKGKAVKITLISPGSNRVHGEEVIREKQSCIMSALKIVAFVALFPFIAITRMVYRSLNKFYVTPLKLQKRNTPPVLTIDTKPAQDPQNKSADQTKPSGTNPAPTTPAKPVTPPADSKPTDPTKPADKPVAEPAKPADKPEPAKVVTPADLKPTDATKPADTEPTKPEEVPVQPANNSDVPAKNDEAIGSSKSDGDNKDTSAPAEDKKSEPVNPQTAAEKPEENPQANQSTGEESNAPVNKPQSVEPSPVSVPVASKPEEKPPVVVAQPDPEPIPAQPVVNKHSELTKDKDAADAQSKERGAESDASASQEQQQKPADVPPQVTKVEEKPNPAPVKMPTAGKKTSAPTPAVKKQSNGAPVPAQQWTKRTSSNSKITISKPAETTTVAPVQPVKVENPQPRSPSMVIQPVKEDPISANTPDTPAQVPANEPVPVSRAEPIAVLGLRDSAQVVSFIFDAHQRSTSPSPVSDEKKPEEEQPEVLLKTDFSEVDKLLEDLEKPEPKNPSNQASTLASQPAGNRDTLAIEMDDIANITAQIEADLAAKSDTEKQAEKTVTIAAQKLPQPVPSAVSSSNPKVEEQAQAAQVVAAKVQLEEKEYKKLAGNDLYGKILKLIAASKYTLALEYLAYFFQKVKAKKEFAEYRAQSFILITSAFDKIYGDQKRKELIKPFSSYKKEIKPIAEAQALINYYKEHRCETDAAKVEAKQDAKLSKVTLSEPKYPPKQDQSLVGSKNETKLNGVVITNEQSVGQTIGISTTSGSGNKVMEDYSLQQIVLLGNVQVPVHGVFDGHSEDGKGSNCAKFLKDNMGLYLAKAFEGKTSLDSLTVKNGVTDAFVKLNEAWQIEKAKTPKAKVSGSTACVSLAFIDPSNGKPVVYIANTGDSRAVFFHDEGIAQLSTDASYRVETADPADSINKKFQNSIAVRGGDLTELSKKHSLGGVVPLRSFGHADIRGNTVRPEISRFYPHDYKNSRLVLFTDGTGDVIGSKELPELAKDDTENLSMADFANRIVRESVSRWSALKKSDNNTVIAIKLS